MQLQLDIESGKEWDLLLVETGADKNGDKLYNFKWQDDINIDLPQRIKYYLRTYRGEYPIREEIGLPYFQQFFKKNADIAKMENTITQYIAERLHQDTTVKVEEIECNITNFDPSKRVIEVFLYIKTQFTEVTINEVF